MTRAAGADCVCWGMVARVIHLIRLLIVLASGHRHLVLENLALRQQLAVYRRTRPKPATTSESNKGRFRGISFESQRPLTVW